MVPEDQHGVVGGILVLAEAQEFSQRIRIGSRLQGEIRYFGELAVLIQEALCTVGVHHVVAPVGRTAGLHDDLDVVGPDAGSQLIDICRSTAQAVGDDHILRHGGRGRSHRNIRIIEEGRQFQTVFRELVIKTGQTVESFVLRVRCVGLSCPARHGRSHIGEVVLSAVLQVRSDEVDADGPGFVRTDGRQRFDPLKVFIIDGRHLIDFLDLILCQRLVLDPVIVFPDHRSHDRRENRRCGYNQHSDHGQQNCQTQQPLEKSLQVQVPHPFQPGSVLIVILELLPFGSFRCFPAFPPLPAGQLLFLLFLRHRGSFRSCISVRSCIRISFVFIHVGTALPFVITCLLLYQCSSNQLPAK